MNEPVISKDFTIDDIHKIREYNYERRKGMTFEQKQADIAKSANAVMKLIEQKRKEKQLVTQ